MEINNGIIIDGVLHELCVGICDECSLQNECDDSSEIICDIAYDPLPPHRKKSRIIQIQ